MTTAHRGKAKKIVEICHIVYIATADGERNGIEINLFASAKYISDAVWMKYFIWDNNRGLLYQLQSWIRLHRLNLPIFPPVAAGAVNSISFFFVGISFFSFYRYNSQIINLRVQYVTVV